MVPARHGLATSSDRAHRVKIVGGRGRGRGLVLVLVKALTLVVAIKSHRRHRHQSNARHCTGWPPAQTGPHRVKVVGWSAAQAGHRVKAVAVVMGWRTGPHLVMALNPR